jgi:hypothetical protein
MRIAIYALMCAALLLSACAPEGAPARSGIEPILMLDGSSGTAPFRGLRHVAAAPCDGSIHVLDSQGLHVFSPSGEYLETKDLESVPRSNPQPVWSFWWDHEGRLVLRDTGGHFRLDGESPTLPPRDSALRGNVPPYVGRFGPRGCVVEFRGRLGEVQGERLPWRRDVLHLCREGPSVDSVSIPIVWTSRLPESRRTPPPMGESPVTAFDRHGRYWFAVSRGTELLGLSSTGDTLVQHTVDAIPRLIPHSERVRLAEEWTDMFRVEPTSVPPTEPVGRAIVPYEDSDRVLYFLRTQHDAAGTLADVFTWERHIGRVRFAYALELLHHKPTVRNDRLFGVMIDSDGRERVVVYELPF